MNVVATIILIGFVISPFIDIYLCTKLSKAKKTIKKLSDEIEGYKTKEIQSLLDGKDEDYESII